MVILPFWNRFIPSEEELVCYYLKNYVLLNWVKEFGYGVMIEQDLYAANATPWELFKKDDDKLPWLPVVDNLGKEYHSEKVLYVFTRLSNVGKTDKSENKQKKRVAGRGTWHGNTPLKPVKDRNGRMIGSKRTLTFRSNEESVGQWTMTEYVIDSAVNGINFYCEDIVLCKIKRDDSKSSKDGRLLPCKRSMNNNVSMTDAADTAYSGQGHLGKKRKTSTETYSQAMNDTTNSVPMYYHQDQNATGTLSVNYEAVLGNTNDGGCDPSASDAAGGSTDDMSALNPDSLIFTKQDYTDPNLAFDLDTLFSSEVK